MRIVVLTMGSRGDLQPFVALSMGLAARGHEVTVASHARFRPDVERRGLAFRALPGEPGQVFANPAWEAWRPSSWRPFAHARMLGKVLSAPLGETTLADYGRACEGADAVLFMISTVPAHQVCVERGLPSVGLNYGPLYRTSEFGHLTLFPRLRAGGLLNLVSHDLGDRLIGQPLREPLRPATRRMRGLSSNPYGRSRRHQDTWPPFAVVHGFSEALVPRPADWPRHLHVTGSWIIPPEPGERPPAAVEAFLQAGSPPIHVGFGSLGGIAKAERALRMLVGAIREAGERVVVDPGWADLGAGFGAGDDGVLVVDDVPHAVLLPRVKAVVHHGGTGTTAAGMAAGLPTLVVPFIFDQVFWGSRVAALGAGPKPLEAHRFTPERLRAAVAVLCRPDVRAAAERIADRMRDEDAVRRGAALVERLLEEQPS